MATAKKVMETAASFIGTHENPLGSNNVIFNTDYYGAPVSGEWYPWCCAFVWDIFRMAGASNLFYYGNRTAYCPTVANWGAIEGLVVDYNNSEYGDIVLFDWNNDGVADHIGFVERLNSDGRLLTIEGNTSDADHSNGGYVLRRTRDRNTVYMVIRPKYDSTEDYYTFKTKTIRKGDKGLDVFRLQIILRARGYFKGKPNSTFDSALELALMNWQEKAGFPRSGICDWDDWATLLGLKMSGDSWIVESVHIGDMGNKSVLLLQEMLKGLPAKYYRDDLDWGFGKNTKNGLTKFQKAANKNGANLPEDGVWDRKTIAYMIG